MPDTDIEITILSLSGGKVTYEAPPNTTFLTLLEAAGEEIKENLLASVQSADYCLTLVLSDLSGTLKNTKIMHGAVLQISPVNKIPEKAQLKLKSKTLNPQ